jgi:hypothetical protein
MFVLSALCGALVAANLKTSAFGFVLLAVIWYLRRPLHYCPADNATARVSKTANPRKADFKKGTVSDKRSLVPSAESRKRLLEILNAEMRSR